MLYFQQCPETEAKSQEVGRKEDELGGIIVTSVNMRSQVEAGKGGGSSDSSVVVSGLLDSPPSESIADNPKKVSRKQIVPVI